MSRTRVGFVADIINGFPFPSSDFRSEEGTPLVRIRDILATEFSTFVPRGKVPDEAWIRDGDVVVGMDGDFNSVVWSRGPAALNQRVCLLRVRHEHDPRFVNYAIQDELKRVNTIAYATTVKHLSASDVFNLRIPALTTRLQGRIANYLDREIAEMDAMNADLDALIETLTERRGRVSHHMLSALFSDAPLYPLWSILSPKKDQGHPDEQVLSVYRAYGVILKDSREDNNNRTPENVSSYQLVQPGDLVVNKMKAWQGSLGVSPHRGIVSPDYQVCRVISDNVDPDYLHVVLRSAHMVPQYRVRSKGVRPAQWRLYWEDMAPLGIPLPSLDEQRRIVAELDASTTRIDAMVADAERLKALLAERKSTLITEAVTGRKEAPGA